MVRILNPPTPRTPPKSHSAVLVTDHEKRIEAELGQLVIDIRRIGPTYPDPSPNVLFGELFDDEQVQNYYEALVGTLKSAKKRGIVSFKGQMLLKGAHDNHVITIVDGDDMDKEEGKENDLRQPAKSSTRTPSSSKKFTFPSPKASSPRKSPIVQRKKSEIQCTCSDTEAEIMGSPRAPNRPILSISTAAGALSDSETASWRPKLSPRDRIVVPLAFAAGNSVDKSGRPPAPWRIRKARSEAARTAKVTEQLQVREPMTDPACEMNEARNGGSERLSAPTIAEKSGETPTVDSNTARSKAEEKATTWTRPKPLAKAQSMSVLTTQASSRIDDEVHQLVKDISRVGANSGEPSVTFGELFDDDEVQQTYEALVGTLRSAKRQGYVEFKGQMLFKGIHDGVVIHALTNEED